MRLADLGLRAGLTLGVGLMLFGAFVMFFASSDPGGGLMIVLGLLFFVPGAFIAGSTLVAFLSARLYGSLSNTAKQKVKLSVLIILPAAWITWSAVEAYLHDRPSAVAERQRVEAERAQLQEAAHRRFQAAGRFLVGTWQNADQPDYFIVFDNERRTYRTDGGETHLYENWDLSKRTEDPSSAIRLKFYGQSGYTTYEVLQVDDTQLVTELSGSSGHTNIDQGSATQSFSRVTDTATLRKLYPRAGSIIMQRVQPGAETRFVDGVTHWYFEEPVPVTTYGGIVRSGPGHEYNKVTSMYKGDPVVLIAVTEIETKGFLWFQIRYRDGQDGYALGGLLCPREVSIDGLKQRC